MKVSYSYYISTNMKTAQMLDAKSGRKYAKILTMIIFN